MGAGDGGFCVCPLGHLAGDPSCYRRKWRGGRRPRPRAAVSALGRAGGERRARSHARRSCSRLF